MSALMTSIQHSTGNPSYSDYATEIKGIYIRKESQIVVCRNDLIYMENPKNSTKKNPVITNK
jgi:hypothetical protein